MVAMASAAIPYTYQYLFASTLAAGRLRVATSGGTEPHPYFFRGSLLRPRQTADLLLALAAISRARFYMPPNMIARILAAADPVVTSGGGLLRLEAFSMCCGAYARVDLLPDAVRGDFVATGTTNVDFNPKMRLALGRVRDSEEVELAVGSDRLELTRTDERVTEKKVELPLRWIKGFVEVQAYQSRMERRFEISGDHARRFLRSVPRRDGFQENAWVVPSARGVRISQVANRDGVAVGGLSRLRTLEEPARHARSLVAYATPDEQISGWELILDEARFHLVLSPDSARGFSGEGQVLSALADDRWKELLPRVRAQLRWEQKLDARDLGQRLSTDEALIRQALAALGSRGLVGFDLEQRAYFHRELPFDLDLIDDLQPRLKEAREIVSTGGVRTIGPEEAYVRGSDVEHRVRRKDGSFVCTCPWFSRNQGKRGPCKHILAAEIALGTSSD